MQQNDAVKYTLGISTESDFQMKSFFNGFLTLLSQKQESVCLPRMKFGRPISDLATLHRTPPTVANVCLSFFRISAGQGWSTMGVLNCFPTNR